MAEAATITTRTVLRVRTLNSVYELEHHHGSLIGVLHCRRGTNEGVSWPVHKNDWPTIIVGQRLTLHTLVWREPHLLDRLVITTSRVVEVSEI